MPENYKIVCQLDAEGYLVGEAVAFENPIRPERFLIPGGAIDQPIPEIPDGKRARWSDGAWLFEEQPEQIGI